MKLRKKDIRKLKKFFKPFDIPDWIKKREIRFCVKLFRGTKNPYAKLTRAIREGNKLFRDKAFQELIASVLKTKLQIRKPEETALKNWFERLPENQKDVVKQLSKEFDRDIRSRCA